MTIAVGDRVPEVKVFTFGEKGPEATTSTDVLGQGKVVLFGVPGAFTPTCSDHHLPGFVLRAEELRAKGVDKVVCVSVNDPFVMGAWGQGPERRELGRDAGGRQRRVGRGHGSHHGRQRVRPRVARRSATRRSSRTASSAGWRVEPGPGLNASSAEEVLAAL